MLSSFFACKKAKQHTYFYVCYFAYLSFILGSKNATNVFSLVNVLVCVCVCVCVQPQGFQRFSSFVFPFYIFILYHISIFYNMFRVNKKKDYFTNLYFFIYPINSKFFVVPIFAGALFFKHITGRTPHS